MTGVILHGLQGGIPRLGESNPKIRVKFTHDEGVTTLTFLTGTIDSTRGVKTTALLFHLQIGVNSTFFVCCVLQNSQN